MAKIAENSLTAKDLEDAFEAMKTSNQGEWTPHYLLKKETYEALQKFLVEDKAYYDAQPWYRKLIYHWNMWRTKV